MAVTNSVRKTSFDYLQDVLERIDDPKLYKRLKRWTPPKSGTVNLYYDTIDDKIVRTPRVNRTIFLITMRAKDLTVDLEGKVARRVKRNAKRLLTNMSNGWPPSWEADYISDSFSSYQSFDGAMLLEDIDHDSIMDCLVREKIEGILIPSTLRAALDQGVLDLKISTDELDRLCSEKLHEEISIMRQNATYSMISSPLHQLAKFDLQGAVDLIFDMTLEILSSKPGKIREAGDLSWFHHGDIHELLEREGFEVTPELQKKAKTIRDLTCWKIKGESAQKTPDVHLTGYRAIFVSKILESMGIEVYRMGKIKTMIGETGHYFIDPICKNAQSVALEDLDRVLKSRKSHFVLPELYRELMDYVGIKPNKNMSFTRYKATVPEGLFVFDGLK